MSRSVGIGAVAERVGLSVDTLRYYERAGVIPPPARDESGVRRYTDADIHLLEVLLHLRDTGMPLTGISRFTALVLQDPDGVPERLDILRAHKAELLATLERLTGSLAVIDGKIADYEARMPLTG